MLAERYDCILFDLDGVLYRGEDAVPSAPPTLAELAPPAASVRSS